MMTNEQKKRLRAIGHQLKPVVTIAGNGLSENVVLEVQRALNDHELIKVKLHVEDRILKRDMISTLCESCKAELVQMIGHVALIYRAASKPNARLSNLQRQQP